MDRYITLGANEFGEVFGLQLGEDGRWKRDPLGISTACAVIRPMSKETYKYVAEDPESARGTWESFVAAGKTDLGLEEWFKEYVSDYDPFDGSFVFELLDDEDNPTIAKWYDNRLADGDHEFEVFEQYVDSELVKSPKVAAVEFADDVYAWECSGWFPPKKPFVVEFAPKELLEEYYAHLRETCKEFKG